MADDPIVIATACLRLGMHVVVLFTKIPPQHTVLVYRSGDNGQEPEVVLPMTNEQANQLADLQVRSGEDSAFANMNWTVSYE